MLQSSADFAAFRDAVSANPILHLEAQPESAVLEDQFKQLNGILNFVSYFVGSILALGATLSAVNSLYAVVDSRRRELVTLRAIGFGPGAIVASLLAESILLAIPGALVGCVLTFILFDGLATSPFGFSFQLAVTPALRAARIPVTTALRAT